MWLLDRIDSWLNGRDEDAVKDELLVVDATEADAKEVGAAMKAMDDEADEAGARTMIAEAKAHGRELDIAESDSDGWGPPDWTPPERRERATVAEGADDQVLPTDEDQLEEAQ